MFSDPVFSPVAAAAYRAGEKLEDERTGLSHDYTRKEGVEHSEIFTPQGVGAPEWAGGRAELWNEAEGAENRKNSVTSREMNVALPDELSANQRQELAQAFAQEIADRYNVAADLNIHAPSETGDERNHHFHLQWTTREIGPEGFGKKTRVLDDRKTGPQEVEWMRQRWEEMGNEALIKNGHEPSLDRRSLKDQGVKQLPQVHEGPAARAKAKRGAHSERIETNAAIKHANAEIIELGRTIQEIRAKKEQLQKRDSEKAAQQQIQAEQDRYQSRPGSSATKRAARAQNWKRVLLILIQELGRDLAHARQHQRKIEQIKQRKESRSPHARAEKKIIPPRQLKALQAARKDYAQAQAEADNAGLISRIWKCPAAKKSEQRLKEVKKPIEAKYGKALDKLTRWHEQQDKKRAQKFEALERRADELRQQLDDSRQELKSAEAELSCAEHDRARRERHKRRSGPSRHPGRGVGR